MPFLGLSVALKALSAMPRCGDLACVEKDLTPCVSPVLRAEHEVHVAAGEGLRPRLDRPFRALNFVVICSQGVALGWHRLPLWGGRLQFR